tara:strand:- start:1455 stop:2045 length:591 start_codon:yes stop_codon:yes gene_type:complete
MINHPIPSVTEKFQFRAIGLIKGIYIPFDIKKFYRGKIIDCDSCEVDTVVLGKAISIIKKYIDIDKPHLWVVYPRTNGFNNLHLQISGVWEPNALQKQEIIKLEKQNTNLDKYIDELNIIDNYFSVRGELIFTNTRKNQFIIKILQKKNSSDSSLFQLKIYIHGKISQDYLNRFLDVSVLRKDSKLLLQDFELIDS